jgi:hypothetical protein
MKSNITFLAPILSGIIIGLSRWCAYIMFISKLDIEDVSSGLLGVLQML